MLMMLICQEGQFKVETVIKALLSSRCKTYDVVCNNITNKFD